MEMKATIFLLLVVLFAAGCITENKGANSSQSVQPPPPEQFHNQNSNPPPPESNETTESNGTTITISNPVPKNLADPDPGEWPMFKRNLAHSGLVNDLKSKTYLFF